MLIPKNNTAANNPMPTPDHVDVPKYADGMMFCT